MSQRKLFNIPVDRNAHPETVERWQDLRVAVASELGVDPDDLARWEVLREASEGYLGRDACGRWREQE